MPLSVAGALMLAVLGAAVWAADLPLPSSTPNIPLPQAPRYQPPATAPDAATPATPAPAPLLQPLPALDVAPPAIAPADKPPDLAAAREQFNKGQYTQCIDQCTRATKDDDVGSGNAAWWVLQIKAQLATGKYADALKTYNAAIAIHDSNVQLRLLGWEVLRDNNKPGEAADLLGQIKQMATDSPWRYTSAEDQVAVGEAMLKSGGDARQVLENYFDKAQKADSDSPDAYIASGQLALDKSDDDTASDSFTDAAEHDPDNPEIYVGLAKASEDDPETYAAAMKKVIDINPHYVPALLLGADHLMSQEDYADAEEVLADALKVNPSDARVWAYRAALANLTGDHKKEVTYRDQALSTWKTNPDVDYLIGHLLSRSYRFAEGVAYQRKALGFDPANAAAQAQLCSDLLRTGNEDEGWKLADSVFKNDPYNVTAFNLVTLHDIIAKFKTVENDHFILRMDPKEADLYGPRLLDLLERARTTLTAKYQVTLPQKTTVEMFAAQKDFAIRTFGLPGGADYLGVCFGPVVTLTSPATRAQTPQNWEDIAWHEFCHTMTLTKTHNKMPRWISEGISVYEETQENPSWGQHMTPEYRELILQDGGKQITPVSNLSKAFLDPDSPEALLFGYYEASRVVDYIVQKYGMNSLLAVLNDVGNDVPLNDALSKHTVPIAQLDKDFAAWFKTQAEALAPLADFKRPELPDDSDQKSIDAWLKAHQNNFHGLMTQGQELIANRKWEDAKAPLEQAAKIFPTDGQADSPYVFLAVAYHNLNDTAKEREVLQKFADLNGDEVDARVRLMEIDAAKQDWKKVRKEADQTIAINPLFAAPFQYLAKATEALDQKDDAITAYRTLLILDPVNMADDHYHLGKLLADEKQLPTARREIDMALEDAPRYREAAKLLLQIAAEMDAETPPATGPAISPTTMPAGVSPR